MLTRHQWRHINRELDHNEMWRLTCYMYINFDITDDILVNWYSFIPFNNNLNNQWHKFSQLTQCQWRLNFQWWCTRPMSRRQHGATVPLKFQVCGPPTEVAHLDRAIAWPHGARCDLPTEISLVNNNVT